MNKTLQVALDLFSTEDALRILGEVGEYVDIIEIGTPLIVAEGARVVNIVKKRYPDKIVFADIKVMDGGAEVPKSVLEAGADMFSVLAAAEDSTLRAATGIAREYLRGALTCKENCSRWCSWLPRRCRRTWTWPARTPGCPLHRGWGGSR